MQIIGLTGGIAMGKSTAGRMLRRLGLPVWEADQAVHRLTGPNGRAVPAVLAAFPGVGAVATGIDRRRLGALVFADPAALQHLEQILHPQVHRDRRHFLQQQRRLGRRRVVLDIPLLFETPGRRRTMDRIWTVSAPPWVQRRRALARPGMTADKLRGILARQVPPMWRLAWSDRIIRAGAGFALAMADLRCALSATGRKGGRLSRPHRRR